MTSRDHAPFLLATVILSFSEGFSRVGEIARFFGVPQNDDGASSSEMI
jgi:hypothetical protein